MQAATWNAAQTLEPGSKTGRIAAGYEADMILLDGDPLTDVSVTGSPAAMVLAGRYLPADALAKLKAEAGKTDIERSKHNVMEALAVQQN